MMMKQENKTCPIMVDACTGSTNYYYYCNTHTASYIRANPNFVRLHNTESTVVQIILCRASCTRGGTLSLWLFDAISYTHAKKQQSLSFIWTHHTHRKRAEHNSTNNNSRAAAIITTHHSSLTPLFHPGITHKSTINPNQSTGRSWESPNILLIFEGRLPRITTCLDWRGTFEHTPAVPLFSELGLRLVACRPSPRRHTLETQQIGSRVAFLFGVFGVGVGVGLVLMMGSILRYASMSYVSWFVFVFLESFHISLISVSY